MMKLSLTASGNFENKKEWSGLRKHMQHDSSLNHDNKFLNTTDSEKLRKYNKHEVLIDYNSWTSKHFAEYVNAHDESSTHYKYKTVANFLKVDTKGVTRKLSPDQSYVAKVGSLESWNEFKDKAISKIVATDHSKKSKADKQQSANDLLLQSVSAGLADYARDFNHRNPNVKMFEYYVHMDEKGAPHIHAHVMPFKDMGRTAKGTVKKPSTSLNTALSAQFDGKRGKDNLSKFRSVEDSTMLDCVQNRVNKAFPELNLELSLSRKTDVDPNLVTGLNHDVYVADKSKEIAEQQEKLAELTASVARKQREEKDLDSKLARKKALFKEKQADLQRQEQSLKDRDLTLDMREIELNKQEQKIKKAKERCSEYFNQLQEWAKNETDKINMWLATSGVNIFKTANIVTRQAAFKYVPKQYANNFKGGTSIKGNNRIRAAYVAIKNGYNPASIEFNARKGLSIDFGIGGQTVDPSTSLERLQDRYSDVNGKQQEDDGPEL